MIRHQPLTLIAVLLTSLTSGGWSARQGAPAEEQLKQLVVMVQGSLDEQAFNGAGIIFGRQANRLYIVTANHVVRSGLKQAEQVRVQFKWLPGDWWDARVLEHVDRDFDLAVLSVSGIQELEVPALAWSSLSPPDKLAAGDRLRPVGYPRGVPWFTPQQRHLFHSATALHIRSEGELDPGNSGGALVTEDWGIVGIASQADRPYNRFSRIDRAIDRLVEWGYHVDLTQRTPPATSANPAPPAANPAPPAANPATSTSNPGTPASKPGTPAGNPATPAGNPKITYEGPRVLKEVQPLYPAEAKARRAEGTVEMTCVIAPDGRATQISVVKSIDPRLDQAAIEALKQWQFSPAIKFGEPVPARMTIEMTFSLK